MTDLGRVVMSAVGSRHKVEAWRDGPILPTGSGYGGWTVVPREGETGTVEYTGPEPKRWTVPLALDGWSDGVSVQADWDSILALAEQQDELPPPQVNFAGTVPPKLAGRAWLIETITPPTEEMVSRTNELLRLKFVLSLIAPVFTKDISSPIKQARNAPGALKSSRTIKARPGDTLVSIAARELGDPMRWREISALNNSLEPDNVKAGQKIKLP